VNTRIQAIFACSAAAKSTGTKHHDPWTIRTVQEWLGHESLATTQKYLEPSKETERQLEAMKLPF
jgi:integrase